MQTKSHHSTITEKSFDPARLIQQGGSFLAAITCQDSLGHSGEINEEKPCFVLGFSNHQKKHPLLFNRPPLRNDTFCARRGHFNYRQAWAVLPDADPGRRTRWGGGNRFIRRSLTLGSNCREVQRGTRLLGSTLLLRPDTECWSSLVVSPWTCSSSSPSAKTWSLCSPVTRALLQARPVLK